MLLKKITRVDDWGFKVLKITPGGRVIGYVNEVFLMTMYFHKRQILRHIELVHFGSIK